MTDKIVLKLEEGVKLRAVNQKPAESLRIRAMDGMPIRSVAQNPTTNEGALSRTTAQAPQTSEQNTSTSDNSQKN